MNKIIEGVVVSLTPIKETSSMVNVVTEEGVVSFYARSANKPSNENFASLSLLSYSRFELSEGPQKGLSLSKGTILESFTPEGHKLEQFLVIDLILEALGKYMETITEGLLEVLLLVLRYIKKDLDYLLITAYFLKEISRLSGWMPEMNGCVICGSRKNIVSFDQSSGGLVCKSCFDGLKMTRTDNEVLLGLRFVYLITGEKLPQLEIKEEVLKEIIRLIADHLYYQSNKQLVSVQTMLRV